MTYIVLKAPLNSNQSINLYIAFDVFAIINYIDA